MIGKFITVEGIDGAGKSTHIERIAAILKDYGVRVVVTREPGGTDLGERVRDILLYRRHVHPVTETMMMFAARHEHYVSVIRPALRRGDWVLCDRFTDSTYAYQGGGKGVFVSVIATLEKMAHNNDDPNLTLYFDLPVNTAFDRLAKSDRIPDSFEKLDENFFYRVRNAFLDRAKMFPERIKVVNADGTIEDVQARVENVVYGYLNNCITPVLERTE